MFCPNCGTEYRRGYTECADCGAELVHERPVQESKDQTRTPEQEEKARLVDVYSTYSQTDVMLVKSCLDAEGITYNFQGELFRGSGIFITPATLYVARADADRVKRILEDHGIK